MSSGMMPVLPLRFLSTGPEGSVQAFLSSRCAPSPPPTEGLPYPLPSSAFWDSKCSLESRSRDMLASVRRPGHLGLPSWRLRALLTTLSTQHCQLLGMGLEVTLA